MLHKHTGLTNFPVNVLIASFGFVFSPGYTKKTTNQQLSLTKAVCWQQWDGSRIFSQCSSIRVWHRATEVWKNKKIFPKWLFCRWWISCPEQWMYTRNVSQPYMALFSLSCSCSSLDIIHSFSIQKAFARLVQKLLLYGNAPRFSESNSSYFVHFVHCLSLWCFILLHWVLTYGNSQALSEAKWQPKELQLQELHQGRIYSYIASLQLIVLLCKAYTIFHKHLQIFFANMVISDFTCFSTQIVSWIIWMQATSLGAC